ncbi:MAG: DoxX family protein [Pseudomonadota bacterium]
MTMIGRVGVALLFILGGINKMVNFDPTLERMAHEGLPSVDLLLPIVILLELGGGIVLALGRRYASSAAFTLALFTLLTNFVFHDFWNMQGQLAMLELSLFSKNVAIVSALTFLASACLVRDRVT